MKNVKVKNLTVLESRPAFLFAWNSNPDMFEGYKVYLQKVKKTGKCTVTWRCNTKNPRPGDRIFLIKVGKHPKGIIGSGIALTHPYDGAIDLELETLLNAEEAVLDLALLKKGKFSQQNWTPQSNGISIRPEIQEELEIKWAAFLRKQEVPNPVADNYQEIFSEGEANQILQTQYERNPEARKKCLQHYGYSCVVCDFNFEEKYGVIGKDFIHVHHLIPITTFKAAYKINAIKELRPVCPNCHAMLHKNKTPLTIEALKKMLLNKK